MKHTRWLTGLLVAAALAAGTLAAAYFITPGVRRPSLSEGDILACMEADGSLVLSWPDAGAGSVYLVELHAGGQSLRQHTEKPALALTGVSAPFQVRVQAAASGKNLLGMDRELTSLTSLNAEVASAALETPVLTGEPERGAMTFSWEGGKSPVYAVCALKDGVYLPVVSSSGTGTYLRFDGKEGPELPAHGQPLELALRAGAPGAGYVLYGPPSVPVTVERGELLGDELSLAVQETEPRVYALEWNEARGVEYELREWQDGAWVTLDRPEPAETFRCDLGRLDSGSYHRYQVLTRDRGGERQVEEEVSFYATVTPLYCTVWPIIDLDFCESAGGVQSLGRIPAGTTLCVLEEDGQWFRVRYKDRYGYTNTIGGISRLFDEEFWNYAKLISGVLRHGMPIEKTVSLVESLHLDSESINTWKTGVCRALKQYIADGTKSKGKCPQCGQEQMAYQNGCLTCMSCGYSKCG